MKRFILGLVAALLALPALAQTPTQFNNVRINDVLDVRGEISNATGNLSINDALHVTGAVTLDTTLNVTGLITGSISGSGASLTNIPASALAAGGTFPSINGSALTALNATNIASGSLSDSRLSANVPLINAANVFTANQDIHKATPFLQLYDTGASANNHKIITYNNNGTGGICYLTDAQTTSASCSTTNQPVTWTATTSVVDSLSLHSGSGVLDASGGVGHLALGVSEVILNSTADLSFTAGSSNRIKFWSPITTSTSGTAAAPFRLLPGSAPTTPSNGDMWTTSTGLFVRINGTTVGPLVDTGGSGSPGGSDTQVQYNSSGSFAGDAGLTYNAGTDTLTAGSYVGTTALTVNSVDLTPTVSTFTVNFDTACTTTPSITFNYFKIGPMVTIAPASTSGFPCTSDSTNFSSTSADVPAALRPSATSVVSGIWSGVTINNTSEVPAIEVNIDSSGHMALMHCGAATATDFTCLTNTWTSSNNKSFSITSQRPQFTYYIH